MSDETNTQQKPEDLKQGEAALAHIKEEKEQKKEEKKKKERKPTGRRRLFADYRYDDVRKKNGKVVRRKVYKGKHYGFEIPKAFKKDPDGYIRRIKFAYVGFFLAACAVWLFPQLFMRSQSLGFQTEGSSMTIAYVLIPNLVCTLPLMLILRALVFFIPATGNKYEQVYMEDLTKNLRGQIILLMVCAIITALSQLCFVIINFRAIVSAPTEVGVLACMLVLAGICFFWLRKQEKHPMKVL